jgi:hypothetical protein
MPTLRQEKSARPRDEYIHKLWRIQIDLHPDGHWTWMIETENNGPVWFHSSADRPTFPEIQKYIAEQEWG